MSITVISDYDFKPGADVAEGKAAAAELVEYFKAEVPEVQLSLWLEDRKNPLRHYLITVLDSSEALERVRNSEAIERFIERLSPQIAHSSHISPVGDVWLADGTGVKAVAYPQGEENQPCVANHRLSSNLRTDTTRECPPSPETSSTAA